MNEPIHRETDIIRWAEDRNIFGGATAVSQLKKLREEVRELNDAVVDENTPEIIDGIILAAEVFLRDVGRYPTPIEVMGALLDIDTAVALLNYIASDIRVGDRVMWPLHDDNGKLLHQTRSGSDDTLVWVHGTVRAQPEGWNGPNIIETEDGRSLAIGREWLVKARPE